MERLRFLPLIGVLGLTAWVFWGCLSGPFHFDDSLFLASSQITEAGDVWRILDPAQGRQLTYLTYFLNYRFAGANPAGYHATNLLLHLANVVLVFLFCRITLPAGPHASLTNFDNLLPLGAAAIFALHPLQSEAVNYVYQRSTLLGALFALISLCFFVASEKARSRWRFLLLSGVCYLCAVAGKEAALTLPLVFLAYLWAHAKDPRSLKHSLLRNLWLLLPLVLLMVAGAAWALYWLHRTGNNAAAPGVANIGPLQYLVTQIQVFVTYLRLLIWPSGLSLDHDYSVASVASPYTWFCLSIVLALAMLAFRLRRRNPAFSSLLWIFFIFLAPTSSIVPSADLIFEHRLYLPMIGAAPLLVWAVVRIAGLVVRADRWQLPAWAVLMGILITGYAGVSRHRTYIWGDDIRLWEDAAAKAPHKARPQYNLGVAYLPSNRERARDAFLRAIALRPGHAPALYNLGWIEQTSGRLDAARNYYRAAIQADPAHWQAHQNLANLYVVQGNVAEAIREFRETIRLRAEYWPAYQSLGTLLIRQERYQDASETLARLKHLRPDLPEGYYLMAYALVQEGRVSEAEEELRVLAVTDSRDEFKERIDELRRTISSRRN